ncbi:hypothetical protein R5R35_011878 [Gryllus longicercus]|uniref:Protein kinase domain-containing protein n=1 Tax=Gryllus longicercus TaxID=2509291 RepID=A0AAN9ZGI9_9ORTH
MTVCNLKARNMECSTVDCADYTDESDPFTFPQVKPLYSKLLNRANRSKRRPLLRPFQFIEESQADVPVQTKDRAEGQECEDDSFSINSLSGDLKQHVSIESRPQSGHRNSVNESSHFNVMTPIPIKLQAYSSVQRSVLVKRVLKTPGSKSNENSSSKDLKLLQCPVDVETLPKVTEDKLSVGNRSNRGGRVLKDILNYDLSGEKFVDAMKTVNDSKGINTEKKDVFIMPSIAYRKETGVPEFSRKSPKAFTRMTPGIEMDKNRRNNAMKLQYRNGDVEYPEKPKQVISRETENEKQEMINHNPSIFNRTQPSVLSINNVQYTILSKLGQGGSSQVYQVLDSKTSSLLAVKCVNLVDADEATAMGYLKEIEMLSKLQSSNRVIKLLDHQYLKQQQVLYVVMEKGDTDLSTLLKLMTKSGDVSLPMIIYYWTEMLHAVKQIHDHGIVHADLKPANFLLVCGRLKLIDFGIASAIQTDATSVIKSTMHGTCNYMSPEAIQDPGDSSRTKVGYKSDVWSLGCILYNLLYRKTPFQHITNNIKKLQIIATPSHRIEFPPVDKCPPPLMDALKCCLAYDAKKRPSVAQLLAIDYIWPTSY